MFSTMQDQAVQELHFCQQGSLEAVIAIHNLTLGPAMGGCRFIDYENEAQAVTDALRLAKGMSYKAALAHVPQGGGKAVIMKPKGSFDRQQLFKQFGRFIQSLSGRYITAMDSGTQVQDMDDIRSQTTFVSSSSNIGDPSPATAQGVVLGMLTAVQFQLGQNMQGLRVAIQGLGHVGMALAKQLHKEGVKLIVCDVDAQKSQWAQQAFDAEVVPVDDIYRQECEVFSPCGLGSVLNEKTIPQLQCKVIAGSANNQLATDAMGKILHDQGILYVPDYVINSGGLIFASGRFRGLSAQQIGHEIFRLKDTLNKIFILSKNKKLASHQIANAMAEQVLYGANAHNINAEMQEAV
ncbi:MAG: amino acid dehydrogenase [Bermanella sp.]